MIIVEKREKPGLVPVLLACCISLVITLGVAWIHRFMPAGNSPGLALAQAFLALLFFGLIAAYLSSERMIYFLHVPPNFTVHRVAVVCCYISFYLSCALLFIRLQGNNQVSLGSNYALVWLVVIFFAVLLAVEVAIKRPGHPLTILLLALIGYLILFAFFIQSVPLQIIRDPSFSQFDEAIARYFAGADPYQLYDPDSDAPFSYLPGYWLGFTPLRSLNLDPRWLNGLSYFSTTLLIYWGVPKNRRYLASYSLSLFLLMPYLLTDQSIQAGLLPLGIGLTFFLIARRYFLLGSASLGLSMTISFFSWLLVPFLLVYLLRERPIKYGWIYPLISGLFAASILLPFNYMYPESFLYSSVGYWFEAFSANGFSLTFWLVPLIGEYGLYFLQGFFFIVIFFHYLRGGHSLAKCYGYAASYTAFFLIINRYVESYQLPLILLLAIIGLAAESEPFGKAPIILHRSPTAEREAT